MRRPYIDPTELALLRTLGRTGTGSGLRASDVERERAVETLRRHHADGRLTTDELEERTERAYAATTLGDLDQLFRDLRAPRRATAAADLDVAAGGRRNDRRRARGDRRGDLDAPSVARVAADALPLSPVGAPGLLVAVTRLARAVARLLTWSDRPGPIYGNTARTPIW
jgi:hypothetical protein